MTVERDYLVRQAGECDAFSGRDTILVESLQHTGLCVVIACDKSKLHVFLITGRCNLAMFVPLYWVTNSHAFEHAEDLAQAR